MIQQSKFAVVCPSKPSSMVSSAHSIWKPGVMRSKQFRKTLFPLRLSEPASWIEMYSKSSSQSSKSHDSKEAKHAKLPSPKLTVILRVSGRFQLGATWKRPDHLRRACRFGRSLSFSSYQDEKSDQNIELDGKISSLHISFIFHDIPVVIHVSNQYPQVSWKNHQLNWYLGPFNWWLMCQD